MKITESHTLRQIISYRPLALFDLESESGSKVWKRMDNTLLDFCLEEGLNKADILTKLNALSLLSDKTEWIKMPMYYLIDFLIADHRQFREVDLPAMELIMNGSEVPVFPDRFVLKLVTQEFRYFQEEFLEHMKEEESFLFPKILRNEACFRYKDLPPEVYKGSVNLFFKHNRHTPEAEFKRMFIYIREKLKNQALQEQTKVITENVIAALESFEWRLFRHADLELVVLFPNAGRLEQVLYGDIAPGLSVFHD